MTKRSPPNDIMGAFRSKLCRALPRSAAPCRALPRPAAPDGRSLYKVAAAVITYRREFHFDLSPEVLWERIQEFDQFEGWWPWLTGLQVEGDGLVAGTILHGAVTPPLPYRMKIRIEIVEVDPTRSISGVISGDLIGDARIRFRPEDANTCVEVAWTIEMQQPAMRLAARVTGPLMQWGHDRVVDITVAGFRRRIRRPLPKPGDGQTGGKEHDRP